MAIELGEGQNTQLKVTADNGLNYTPLCSFTSDDPAVATVSASGLVTGVGEGSATITATYLPAGATQPLTDTETVNVSAGEGEGEGEGES